MAPSLIFPYQEIIHSVSLKFIEIVGTEEKTLALNPASFILDFPEELVAV